MYLHSLPTTKTGFKAPPDVWLQTCGFVSAKQALQFHMIPFLQRDEMMILFFKTIETVFQI